MSKYIYQRTGGPLYSWRHGAPRSTAAAPVIELGNYIGDSAIIQPGSPEPLTDVGDGVGFLTKLLALGAVLWVGSKVVGHKSSRSSVHSNPARRRKKRRKKPGYRRRRFPKGTEVVNTTVIRRRLKYNRSRRRKR